MTSALISMPLRYVARARFSFWRTLPRPAAPGVMTRWIILCILLVAATASAAALVVFLALNAEIEKAADRRLDQGARVLQGEIADRQEALLASAAWLAGDLAAPLEDGDLSRIRDRARSALRLPLLDDVLVMGPQGEALVSLSARDALLSSLATPGYASAAAGRPAGGLELASDGTPQVAAYYPIESRDGRS